MDIPDLTHVFADGAPVEQSGHRILLRVHMLGELILPTGAIVATDPFVVPDRPPFTRTVQPGNYRVEVTVADFGTDQRVAFAGVRFRASEPERWELALLDGQDPSTLSADEFFGYGVDTGTGCFMDADAARGMSRHMDDDEDFRDALIAEMRRTYVHTWSWLNKRLDSGSRANIIAFSSGWGDGVYGSYFGLDSVGNVVSLVTDFGVI